VSLDLSWLREPGDPFRVVCSLGRDREERTPKVSEDNEEYLEMEDKEAREGPQINEDRVAPKEDRGESVSSQGVSGAPGAADAGGGGAGAGGAGTGGASDGGGSGGGDGDGGASQGGGTGNA
jgi:hypothetical protein